MYKGEEQMKGIRAELKKQGWIIPVLCCIFPLLVNLIVSVSLSTRYEGYLLLHQSEYGLTNWQLILKEQTIVYFSEIIYVVTAALVYDIYKKELKDNAWIIVASSNYRYNGVTLCKFVVVTVDVLLYFICNYICIIYMGCFQLHIGSIEIGLLMKSFVIQLFSGVMIIAFFELLLCVFRKINMILPIGIVMMILDILLYYRDKVGFALKVPITFISQCYQASIADMIYIIVVGGFLSSLFVWISSIQLKRNYDLQI